MPDASKYFADVKNKNGGQAFLEIGTRSARAKRDSAEAMARAKQNESSILLDVVGSILLMAFGLAFTIILLGSV